MLFFWKDGRQRSAEISRDGKTERYGATEAGRGDPQTADTRTHTERKRQTDNSRRTDNRDRRASKSQCFAEFATASRETAVFDPLCHQFGSLYARRRGESCVLTKRPDVQTPADQPTPAPSKKSRTSRAKLRFLLHFRSRCAQNMNVVEARVPFHKTSTAAKTNYLHCAWGVLHFLGPPRAVFRVRQQKLVPRFCPST